MTTFGTVFKKGGKKALLCGSGELGKEVAIELQRFGIEVVAVDRYANAPAMQIAHKSYVISMLDGEKLRKIIYDEKRTVYVTVLFVYPAKCYELTANYQLFSGRDGSGRIWPM